MMASIRARVSAWTYGAWLMTRETVFFDTPARRAMSVIVSRERVRARFAAGGSPRSVCSRLAFARRLEVFKRRISSCPSFCRRTVAEAFPEAYRHLLLAQVLLPVTIGRWL